jgi:hypothetical protein
VDPAVEAVAIVGFGAAAAFLVVPPVTPFLMVPMTVLFAAGAEVSFVTVFFTTVEVLPSLESLILRAVRVAGRGTGGLDGAAALRVRVFAVVPTALEAVEDVVVFLVGAGRVEPGMPTRTALGGAFIGDAGRAMLDLAGECGALSRGTYLAFVEVGDRIWAVSGTIDAGPWPRCFFFGLSMSPTWFSLSTPPISSLTDISIAL